MKIHMDSRKRRLLPYVALYYAIQGNRRRSESIRRIQMHFDRASRKMHLRREAVLI